MQRRRVVVVGGGVGGLASALDLAVAGFDVVLLERAAAVGGKMRHVSLGGRSVDAGPTVLTMRWVLDELFQAAGTTLAEQVTLERAEVLARHAWSDGMVLDLHADRERSRVAIAEAFGPREGDAYVAYWEDGQRLHDTVVGPFLRSQKPTLTSIVRETGILGLGALTRIDAFRSLWAAIVQRFESPRLRQLFGRYATYCGSSPFEAPATLSLVPYIEAVGVYRVAGGMVELGKALERLAVRHGVEVRCGVEVERIVVSGGRVTGVVAGGVEHRADVVVFNGDVSALGSGRVGKDTARAVRVTPPEARSLSAVTWAVVGRTRGLPLVHHNVLFSDDYAAEFEDLLRRRRLPAAPTVYVCAQDRKDAPVDLDEERMLVVVNAPATGDDPARWTEAERDRCEQSTLATMQRCGLVLEPSATLETTPVELERMFPGTGGALYGPIARGATSALTREGARTRIPGLYVAGGSVHPGPGVPMAILSGRLAALQVRKDLASTGGSRRAATPGTTSTA